MPKFGVHHLKGKKETILGKAYQNLKLQTQNINRIFPTCNMPQNLTFISQTNNKNRKLHRTEYFTKFNSQIQQIIINLTKKLQMLKTCIFSPVQNTLPLPTNKTHKQIKATHGRAVITSSTCKHPPTNTCRKKTESSR